MNQYPIFTDKALRKMQKWGLSEGQVIDALNFGVSEECIVKVAGFRQKMRKYQGYEIGVIYTERNDEHKYTIISTWKRGRY